MNMFFRCQKEENNDFNEIQKGDNNIIQAPKPIFQHLNLLILNSMRKYIFIIICIALFSTTKAQKLKKMVFIINAWNPI
jgi:hypothetical protein